jgi:hypothetical protein
METQKETSRKENEHGAITLALAKFCHNCTICVNANKKPNSTFNKIMTWHRKWCPAWAAHTKVYGPKPL